MKEQEAEAITKLIDKVEDLTKIVEDIKHPPRKKVIKNELLKGIFWAIGKIIGLGTMVIIFYIILANVDLVPGLGKFIAEIIKVVNLNI